MSEPCKVCQNPIDTEATRCPECGYEPRDPGLRVYAVAALGGLLTLTGIGAIIGLPLIYGALKGEREMKDWKPTTHAP